MRLERSSYYYRAHPRDNRALLIRLKELAAVRVRYGYRRLTILLRREGWKVNAKRVYRLYLQENLGVRRDGSAQPTFVFPWRAQRKSMIGGRWTLCQTAWPTAERSGS